MEILKNVFLVIQLMDQPICVVVKVKQMEMENLFLGIHFIQYQVLYPQDLNL